MELKKLIETKDGNTPIAPEELDALIPALSTQSELNEWEWTNIMEAEKWCFGRSLKTENPFTDAYVRKLHEKMFCNTWKWAGVYRKTEKNIGVPVFKIREMLVALLGDAEFWLTEKTYKPHELALRFHHRLVSIHPFPNGNGRHARLMADVIINRLGLERFRWGSSKLTEVGDMRSAYIKALGCADKGDIQPLMKFAI
jgi:Fic-DOC domain mobile mystery protein B